jgi:uncharacterized membrane protein
VKGHLTESLLKNCVFKIENTLLHSMGKCEKTMQRLLEESKKTALPIVKEDAPKGKSKGKDKQKILTIFEIPTLEALIFSKSSYLLSNIGGLNIINEEKEFQHKLSIKGTLYCEIYMPVISSLA